MYSPGDATCVSGTVSQSALYTDNRISQQPVKECRQGWLIFDLLIFRFFSIMILLHFKLKIQRSRVLLLSINQHTKFEVL